MIVEMELDHELMRNPLFKAKDVVNQCPNSKLAQMTKDWNGDDFVLLYLGGSDYRFNFKQLVCQHSPAGMSFGYTGSGPHDCALNILLNYFSNGSGMVSKTVARWIKSKYGEFVVRFLKDMPERGGVIPVPAVEKFIEENKDVYWQGKIIGNLDTGFKCF